MMRAKEILEKINDLGDEREYAARLQQQSSLTGMKDVLAEKGIIVTEEELAQLRAEVIPAGESLGEGDLDQVSGGVVGTLGVLGLAYVGVCTVAFLKGMQAGMK